MLEPGADLSQGSAIPPGSVLLHIGPHKTGTTAIQGGLAAARDELLQHGVSYPGHVVAHHKAARVLRGHPAGWAHDTDPLPDPRTWERLVRSVARHPGRVVVSSEIFAQSAADERQRIVDDLGADRLHVLLAARNPGSIAVSTWQQVLRDGKAGALEDWLESRFRREAPAEVTTGFWSWADAATLVERWSEVLGRDRIHVVVIDETDRTLLPSTFEQLLGLPTGLLSAAMPPVGNRGLTAPEAELVRQVVALTRPQLTWATFSRLVRTGFVRHLVLHRVPPPDEPRPGLPEWAAEQAAVEAGAIIGRLRSSGVHIIGDPEHLRRIPRTAHLPQTVVPVELAAAAVAGTIEAALRGPTPSEARPSGVQASQEPAPQELPSRIAAADLSTRELATELRVRARAAVLRRLPLGRRAT